MKENLIVLLLLSLSVPVGLYISWLSRDELVNGRFWFKAISVSSLIAGFIGGISGKTEITLVSSFIILVSFTALEKSFNEKWQK